MIPAAPEIAMIRPRFEALVPVPFAPFASFALRALSALLVLVGLASTATAAGKEPGWQLADRRGNGADAYALFVESTPTPGRPAFRVETHFTVAPSVVYAALLEGMLDPKEAPSGQTRKVLQRNADSTVVYTFIDLPLMLSDRELALRVVPTADPKTGIHRVVWSEANDVLPPANDDVVRLEGAQGFWEFRPDGAGGTQAIHMTQTELGGSFPAALGDRLMKGQAVEAVEKLRDRVAHRGASDVAAGPP
jgi:hypothetical protein